MKSRFVSNQLVFKQTKASVVIRISVPTFVQRNRGKTRGKKSQYNKSLGYLPVTDDEYQGKLKSGEPVTQS
jgi:hypothetical protein